jgi:hypothetical protein
MKNAVKKLKQKLLLLLLVAIIIPVVTYWLLPSSGGSALSISRFYNTNLQPGQTIELNLTASDVGDLVSVRANLAWDPNVLKLTTVSSGGYLFQGIRYNIREGPFLKTYANSTIFLINNINNNAGNISALFNAITVTGPSAAGSGVIATINFTCVQSGPTAINITGSRQGHSSLQSVAGEQIPHQDVDGLITTDGAPGIWTELWFQTTVGVVSAEVIVIALMIFIIIRWWRTRPELESEEIAELAL